MFFSVISIKGKRINMGLSLYNIPAWTANTNYAINDIVSYNSLFYYCVFQHNSSTAFSSDYWDGITLYNGKNTPIFFWVPSYNDEITVRPSVRTIQYSEGYSQRIPSFINNSLIPINLKFELRTESETRAILHFLESRKASESFLFTPRAPYNIQKLFICQEFMSTMIFVNAYNISCVFTEVPA